MILFIRLLKESLIFAYSSVIANKLRTFLTLLGITIGIFAIISVFTVLDAIENQVRSSISSLGDNIVYIQKFPWTFEEDYPIWEYLKRPVMKMEEYKLIKQRTQLVEEVCFSASSRKNLKYRSNTSENIGVWISSPEFSKIRSFEINQGRYFTPDEAEKGRNACVIGYEIASKLFGNEDPIGKKVDLMGNKITVIGTLTKEGNNIFGGGSLDNVILLTMSYGKNIFDIRSDRINTFIWAKAKPGVNNADMIEELRHLMRVSRHIQPLNKDNFAINQSSMLNQMLDRIFLVINAIGWIIGGFSILVGGFGIANIMFVSVKERTRIIGIQKALGAKQYTILIEFLSESVILSLMGGILGLFFVFTATLLAKYGFDFDVELTITNIIRGLFISGTIGVISGFWPAFTAARMNPVEAINTHF